MKMQEKISAIVGLIAGGIASFFIGLDLTLKILMVFMVIDFILGFINAYVNRQITSNEMYKGAIRKGIIFVIIYIAHQLAVTVNQPMIQDMTIIYYLSMETLSIFEHAVDFDVPLPAFLKDFAEKLNTESDKTEIL